MRADHLATHILVVADAAQRCSLDLRHPCPPGELEAEAMLFQAAIDIPARKQQITMEEMRAGGFLAQPGAFGNALHHLHIRQGAVDIVGNALDRRHSPSSARQRPPSSSAKANASPYAAPASPVRPRFSKT